MRPARPKIGTKPASEIRPLLLACCLVLGACTGTGYGPQPAGTGASSRGGSAASAGGRAVASMPLPRPRPGIVMSRGAEASAPARATVAEVPSRHAVQDGDTVYRIARRFGLPPQAIIAANDLAPPFTLRPGQELVFPQVSQVYVVESGDTMLGLARDFGVDSTRLAQFNRISPPYDLVIGQALMIPADAPTAPQIARAQAQAEAVRPAPPVTPPSDVTEVNAPEVLPPPPTAGTKPYIQPIAGTVITRYGPAEGGLHNDGINIAAPRGTPVRAAANGTVVYAGDDLPGYGQLILLKHGGDVVTAYGHNDTILVRRGQTVRQGEVIGRVGSTGYVNRPQLHFEVRRGGKPIDPASVL